MTIKLKGCPKCKGDLYLVSDIYGRYVDCLQCGFSKDLPQELPQRASLAGRVPSYREVEQKAA